MEENNKGVEEEEEEEIRCINKQNILKGIEEASSIKVNVSVTTHLMGVISIFHFRFYSEGPCFTSSDCSHTTSTGFYHISYIRGV